ncbi:hypothetical protein VB711_19335 [Cronbergia sp. UHCC 0137]|uniref:hypothetical protein n=1 Tax=Cronbergia sp. UHCC 0137 TaxID=3110239 RepID=UPI002B21F0F2|nr:hypothetical protein [Cronbergia sp. UHCC 0137]MEA5619982.1 hypothetical protein [Cronbergia sp. UHCC 0137]
MSAIAQALTCQFAQNPLSCAAIASCGLSAIAQLPLSCGFLTSINCDSYGVLCDRQRHR